MAFIGNQPTAVPLTSSQLADGLITTAKLAADAVTSAKIADGAIVNVDVNSTAALAYSKLNLATSIVNADINASAAIALSKLATTGTMTFASTIGVGGATPAASGAGITFPASASASSDANTLDDYEEGTWTPTFTSGGNTLTITGGTQNFKYVKIGKTCFLSVNYQDVTVSGTVTSSDQRITLPFTSATGIRQPSNIVSFFTSGGLRFTTPTLTYFEIGSNDTLMELRGWSSSGYAQPGTPTTGGGTYFWFTLTYEVA